VIGTPLLVAVETAWPLLLLLVDCASPFIKAAAMSAGI
jgi:hypothetical protein